MTAVRTHSEDVKKEKVIVPKSGGMMLLLAILLALASIACMIGGGFLLDSGHYSRGGFLFAAGMVGLVVVCFLLPGLKIVNPREALVLVLFGKYYGTIREEGFYWVNPFCALANPSSGGSGMSAMPGANKRISLKVMTLNNDKQTVNDQLGNPVIIGTIVIWRVVDTAKAVFGVDHYKQFLSIQCDSAIRNVTRLYPYDVCDASDEKTLRGSSQEVAGMLSKDLQARVDDAGLEIMEVRITHLSYAPEIAAAMLQRQQAEAIIAARQKIVEGAVGMVEMALAKLDANGVVNLDNERKAAMVSNLLVVLCGNKDAQPIVNSGSIY